MHILLVTRHYPPEISGGARRPFLFAKELRALGHKVTVVTPFPDDDPNSLCVPNRAINNGYAGQDSVHLSAKSKREGAGAKFRSFARDWVYWPDHNINWARSVVSALIERDLSPDLVFTTSPPESVHVVGQKISQARSIPWIAELRDTWVEAPHREILARSAVRRFFERRIARHFLKSAHALISVSEAVMREARTYARAGTPELIISHFSDGRAEPYRFPEDTLNLVHTGGFSLSDRRRDLKTLLDLLDVTLRVTPNLVLHIAGPLTSEEKHLSDIAAIPVKLYGACLLYTSPSPRDS